MVVRQHALEQSALCRSARERGPLASACGVPKRGRFPTGIPFLTRGKVPFVLFGFPVDVHLNYRLIMMLRWYQKNVAKVGGGASLWTLYSIYMKEAFPVRFVFFNLAFQITTSWVRRVPSAAVHVQNEFSDVLL